MSKESTEMDPFFLATKWHGLKLHLPLTMSVSIQSTLYMSCILPLCASVHYNIEHCYLQHFACNRFRAVNSDSFCCVIHLRTEIGNGVFFSRFEIERKINTNRFREGNGTIKNGYCLPKLKDQKINTKTRECWKKINGSISVWGQCDSFEVDVAGIISSLEIFSGNY